MHRRGVIVALCVVHLELRVEARLNVLAVDLEQHQLELVGFVVPAHAGRVDSDLNVCDILDPMLAEGAIENLDALGFAHFNQII